MVLTEAILTFILPRPAKRSTSPRRSLPVNAVNRVDIGASHRISYDVAGRAETHPVVRQSTRRALTLEAADDGPGIADLGLAMTDGYSTAGGLGCGLPGAERLMDEFQIESRPGTGTRVRALAWLDGRTK